MSDIISASQKAGKLD